MSNTPKHKSRLWGMEDTVNSEADELAYANKETRESAIIIGCTIVLALVGVVMLIVGMFK